ncbi:MAG: hypothetical protein OIF50_08100, partial [Flavobacteriaceae bacterium]|nr:hypothetical protein [Flavobacteriaceae bacterium]
MHYRLAILPEQQKVAVTVDFPARVAKDIRFVMPQSAPGTYEITPYYLFVSKIEARGDIGRVEGEKGLGTYFVFPAKGSLHQIRYEVDIQLMEQQLVGAFASCKMREDYLGLLGYGVFGFIEGLENHPIQLQIEASADWPLFSTLSPQKEKHRKSTQFLVENYGILADAQYLLGTAVGVFEVPQSPIPLFVAAYAEAPIAMEEIGRRALVSLKGLQDYFGAIPMPHYSLCYEFLEPISPKHDYGLSMEHLNSLTASMPVSKAITAYDMDADIGSTVHHMGHAWLPLRTYGRGYRPFPWQVAPLIDTIWFNEGFIWYISIHPTNHILLGID